MGIHKKLAANKKKIAKRAKALTGSGKKSKSSGALPREKSKRR